jgi:hypothetical protein
MLAVACIEEVHAPVEVLDNAPVWQQRRRGRWQFEVIEDLVDHVRSLRKASTTIGTGHSRSARSSSAEAAARFMSQSAPD